MPRDQLFEQPAFLPPFDAPRHFAGAKVAITGPRGVLGRILAQRLVAAGMTVDGFAGDVTDGGAVDAWVKRATPDLVFHFAAIVPVTVVEADPVRAWSVNVLGPVHLAAAVLRHAPGAWSFFASSSHVYAPNPEGSAALISERSPLGPSGLYGESKLAGEVAVRPLLEKVGAAFCIGRIFSFSHATQRPPYLVPSLHEAISALAAGAPLELKSAGAVRDIVDAETVVDAVLHLARARHQGVVNIGSGKGRTVAEVAELVARRVGKQISIRPAPGAPGNSLVADVRALAAAVRSA